MNEHIEKLTATFNAEQIAALLIGALEATASVTNVDKEELITNFIEQNIQAHKRMIIRGQLATKENCSDLSAQQIETLRNFIKNHDERGMTICTCDVTRVLVLHDNDDLPTRLEGSD